MNLVLNGITTFFSTSSLHEAIIPRGARQGQSQLKRTCSIFAYEDIKEVHKRRYLLQVIMLYLYLINLQYSYSERYSLVDECIVYVHGISNLFPLIISLVCIVFQPIAVEVFSADGRNYLLAFQKGVRNKVYQRC